MVLHFPDGLVFLELLQLSSLQLYVTNDFSIPLLVHFNLPLARYLLPNAFPLEATQLFKLIWLYYFLAGDLHSKFLSAIH